MAYTAHNWVVSEPITQEKMNHIEEGIQNAASTADSNSTALSATNTTVSNLQTTVAGVSEVATNARSTAETALSATQAGNDAWTYVAGAMTFDDQGNVTKNLASRFSENESNLASATTNIGLLNQEISTARGQLIHNGNSVAATNLKAKLDDMDTQISLNKGAITANQTDYNNAKGTFNTLQGRLDASDTQLNNLKSEIQTAEDGEASLNARLDAIDNSTRPTRTLPNVITEIDNAHRSTNDTLDARFDSIDGGAAPSRTLPDIITEVNDAHRGSVSGDTLNQRFNSIDTNINTINTNLGYTGLSSTETVKKKVEDAISTAQSTLENRIDAIDNASTGTVAGLDERVTALETEVDMTSTNSRIDLVTTEVTNARDSSTNGTYGSLDARLEAIESAAATVNTNVNTIASELAMLDNDTIINTNTKIDKLEADVQAFATELDMARDQTGALVDTNTRVDQIANEISHTASGADAGGLKERMTAVETVANNAAVASTVNTALNDLDTRLDAIDGGSALSGDDTLAERVEALETSPKSATIIIDNVTYNEDGIPTNVSNPTTDADYLLKKDDKYYYWKYIQTGSNPDTFSWELISGGGGAGSSSGEFAASLNSIAAPNENTDYFVGNNTIGYTHYRWVPPVEEGASGTFVRILPNGLLINAGVTQTGGLSAYTVNDSNNNVFSEFVAFKDVEATPVKDENEQVVATDLVFTNTNGQTVTARVQGGGGGGSVSSYTMRLNNTLSGLKLTVPKKDGFTAYVKAKVVVKDAGVIDETFDQSHTINVAVQYSTSRTGPWTNYTTLTALNNTEFSVDVTSILTLGQTTYIRVEASTLIDEETKTSSLIYEVTQVEMSIAAVNFNQATVRTTNFNFQYRCMGSGLTKQVHFLIDGTDIAGSPITTTLHNDIGQQTIPITGLAAGMHSFKVYFTVDGIESNILNYYIIYNNDSTRQAPIIALAAENSTITFGDDLKINYTVATIGEETTDEVFLELYALDGSTEVPYTSQTFVNVENEQVKEWRPVEYPESGTAYIRATATHTVEGTEYTDTKTIEITINELELPAGYSLEPAGTSNVVYSYSAYGRTNNDAGKEVYNYDYQALTGQTIEWTGNFNGFNWSGDGYVDGQTLTISGGATHTVNVPIFQNTYNGITLENSEGVTNISKLGRTVEIEYEVASATDLNDVIIDFMANTSSTTVNGVIQKGGVGFQVTPQSCYLLKSGSTVNMDNTGFILNESDIAAAYLTPGVRIHLAFVIEPWSDELAYDGSYHQSVNIYVNGEFANACPYVQGTDSFASSATLRIGSSSCIIKLYQIKMYNRGLTHKEILQNYKVAPAATRDKLTRLYDNDILNADGLVDYEKARTKYTCLLLTGPEPIYTQTTGGETVLSNPTVSPYKGYPSPAGRKDKKTGEAVGKTESGVTLTKANPNKPEGYDIEFDLRDTVPTDQSIEVPAYIGARGAYVSSNNVQGTSSQKYPVHNLKVYLAKWQGPKTTTEEVELEEGEDTTGLEIVEHDGVQYKVVTTTTPAEIKKVKYSLKGKDEHGEDIGVAESTLCWKADYMSTDHANTYNANIADGLFTDVLPGASWGSKHQNTVYGIRCLLFQKQGNAAPEFLGDGCLNNDKGNNKTYSLERNNENGKSNDTLSQKWEFTNNSDDLGYFKTDTVFRVVGEGANAHIQAKDAFESTYPDEGDLKDAGKEPNYNHLQILITWLSKRANYWDETDPTVRAAKKQIFINEFTQHINMDHALTYYLFSEYIALCDNRVKNMFMRSDNVTAETVRKLSDHQPIFEGNSNPNADFFKQIDAIDTGTTQQVAVEDPETHEISYETQTIYRYELHNRDDIDWETGEGHSTFAVWAPVLYDLDSCFGVENVGYIRVRYDANWDYTWNGAPQFNGYESRLWLQFADCFDAEIKAAALGLYNRADGLNYTNFYRQQITDNLNNISPALSNQDMLIKFDKPWSEGFINYSLAEPAKETPYYKYLQRGSRTAQKTAFMNMRSKLLSSKYGANEFTNDAIKFRTGVPVGQENLQDTKITIVANQVMYPGVAYGDNKAPTRATTNGGKANAGQSCDIYATSPVQGNDGIFICGASILTDIGDLSAFRPYQIDVGAGVNLKRLIVGSNAAGYTNGNTDTLMNLNKCVLLEEVNVRNCTNVSTLDLSNNPLIKKVYAAGSGATTLIFPNGGVLNTVEYSAVTGNITILNQKNLQNFIYEGSETNHYNTLNKLWVENTPAVPIVDIINTTLGNLTAGVRLINIDVDLFNGASTQSEIDDAFDTTTQFLQTITSDLAVGKYLDSTGAFIPGNTSYPTITGKVHVTSIRTSLLAKLHELYPNLIIYNTIDSDGTVNNNVITEYTIEYRNYDNTLLYTDYRTGQEHYIDPVYDINPITGAPYIPVPTKPEDAQYKYTFGTYSNGEDYDRYSGWVKQYTTTNPIDDDFVQGNTIFIAYYPTTTIQQYTVTWYEEPNGSPILSYTANYGVDISTYQQPEERGAVSRTKVSGNTTKVFKGWNRPVGKLTSNINVYAQWETSTIDNGTQTISMSDLNAADIYAISQLGAEAKRRLLEDKLGTDPILVQMGHNLDYTEGVNTINLLGNQDKFVFTSSTTEAKIYDGAHGLGEIRPLEVNGDWTLAIDYKFLLNATIYGKSAEYVLASCYKNADSTIQGFKVSLVKNSDATSPNQYVRVTWGTANATIDYVTIDGAAANAKQYSKSYRNMIVLRHSSANPSNLYIYYAAPDITNANATYGSDYGIGVTSTTLTWANNNNFNTPLILGGNYEGNTTDIESQRTTRCPAKAIIYWAKYWDADLGEKNCSFLAQWPHETVPFYLNGYNNNDEPSRQIIDNTNLTFVAAQGIGDRYLFARTSSMNDTETSVGWRISKARTLCNNRIYKGMPTSYQSIIQATGVGSVVVDLTLSTDNVGAETTVDYCYLPAEREISTIPPTNGNKNDEVASSWPSPWPWMQSANVMNLYGFDTGSTSTLVRQNATSIAPFLYRFLGAYIKPTARIYNINTDPYNNGGSWTYDNNQIYVQSGDVWINNNVAYMYFTNAEINEGIYVDIVTNGGGWKKADLWNLRTYNVNAQFSSENQFERIEDDGTLTTSPSSSGKRNEGRLLCPEFSI